MGCLILVIALIAVWLMVAVVFAVLQALGLLALVLAGCCGILYVYGVLRYGDNFRP